MSKKIYKGNLKERSQQALKKYYEKRKKAGVCISCGGERDTPGKTYCGGCSEKINKRWNDKIAQGLCGSCGHQPLFNSTRCEDCVDVQVKRRRELKKKVIQAYGGVCACCKVTEWEFLTVEHTRNDGAEHKRQLGFYGNEYYKWLERENYPKDLGLEILCMNCNFAKGKYGYCPHGRNSLTK